MLLTLLQFFASKFLVLALHLEAGSFQYILDEDGNDTMEQQIQANYRQIKQDIVELVENELIRIENDPKLKHLLGGDEGVQTTS